MPQPFRKRLVVYRREILIRLKAFRSFLLIFLAISLFGTIVLRLKLELPFMQAFYESVSLMFLASSIDFPQDDKLLAMMWIIFPLFGLILLADGLAGIGTAIKFGDPTSKIWNLEVIKLMENHVIIVGIGNVGFKILKEMVQEDYEVTVIDKDTGEGREEFDEFQEENRIPTIIGDATRESVLINAGIEKASQLILVTDDDFLNLKISLKAKKLNSKLRIIVRMFDLEFGNEIKDKIGIDSIISTSTLSVPYFLKAVNE